MYEYLSPVKCIFEYGLTQTQFNQMMKDITLNFIQSIVHPGEMVGIIAAQSVGEPTSQMTLNTKHLAGVAKAGSASMGVSRILELFHNSKNIKSPQMTIYFNKEYNNNKMELNKVVSYFEHLIIYNLISNAEIYYDVFNDSINSKKLKKDNVSNPFFINNIKTELSSLPFVIRIIFNIEKLLEKEITLLDIKTRFITHWYKNYTNIKTLNKTEKDIITKISRCAILSNSLTDDEQIIHIRFSMNAFNYNDITSFLNIILNNITLKGIENIVDTDTTQERIITFNENNGDIIDDKEYVVYTSGINMQELKYIKGIDLSKTRCNDIITIYKLYGIEATRHILLYELTEAYKSGGSSINRTHLSLLVDQMCHLGEITAMDRHGLAKIDIDPIARASFEKTMEHFINAAIFNEKDTLKSISSSIAVGQAIPGGTGSFELLLDTKKLELSEYTDDETSGRVTFISLEEEPLINDILKREIKIPTFFLP
jgi:DNA-directed RNA polymerase II subunit RPB1